MQFTPHEYQKYTIDFIKTHPAAGAGRKHPDRCVFVISTGLTGVKWRRRSGWEKTMCIFCIGMRWLLLKAFSPKRKHQNNSQYQLYYSI